ncbi:hypothetical protein GFS24_25045 [Chitinophaga sp. SYP-B3965]|uniref:hypothetical protein n=1 Tax=Chitinophaga sp. SYP-B3965 TaxID=2663120 RepID=UPI0012997649|nr:hypothetical protein [Chitinophaga sp. SYP-B3965]MRG48406.1 hypothetical protein [Chitinophaga sp. SYP-B3965]
MYKVNLNQEFYLHPVGQGLFYSGNVDIEPISYQKFFFVFDCGSLNKANIKEEIEQYKRVNFPDGGTIDLLIISHFDADHVNHLSVLLEGMKVKKIVAPFINFEERLFLVLRLIGQKQINTNNADDLTVIDNIIDPVGNLGEYLDDGGEFILINSDPENPPFPPPSNTDNNPDRLRNEGDGINFGFERGTALMTQERLTELKTKPGMHPKEVKDSQKGLVSVRDVAVMEFLFYRKDIGKDNAAFFKKVYELLIKKYALEFKDPASPGMDELVKVIKSMASATIVKELFKDALKEVKGISIAAGELMNMNTTALSLMHYNLYENFRMLTGNGECTDRRFYALEVKKMDGTLSTQVFTKLLEVYYYRYDRYLEQRIIPNTLFTSDSFLLAAADVNAFYEKYKHYWDAFWLFQIPHHGSNHNSNLHLLTRLHFYTRSFINYGVNKSWGGKWRHPSPPLIADLTAAGLSAGLMPVNEYNGYKFAYAERWDRIP